MAITGKLSGIALLINHSDSHGDSRPWQFLSNKNIYYEIVMNPDMPQLIINESSPTQQSERAMTNFIQQVTLTSCSSSSFNLFSEKSHTKKCPLLPQLSKHSRFLLRYISCLFFAFSDLFSISNQISNLLLVCPLALPLFVLVSFPQVANSSINGKTADKKSYGIPKALLHVPCSHSLPRSTLDW